MLIFRGCLRPLVANGLTNTLKRARNYCYAKQWRELVWRTLWVAKIWLQSEKKTLKLGQSPTWTDFFNLSSELQKIGIFLQIRIRIFRIRKSSDPEIRIQTRFNSLIWIRKKWPGSDTLGMAGPGPCGESRISFSLWRPVVPVVTIPPQNLKTI